MTDTITIPAHSEVLNETMTLHAPVGWHERIKACSVATVYGPNYCRAVVDALADMSGCVRSGYSTVAYDHLLFAEYRAGIVAERPERTYRSTPVGVFE